MRQKYPQTSPTHTPSCAHTHKSHRSDEHELLPFLLKSRLEIQAKTLEGNMQIKSFPFLSFGSFFTIFDFPFHPRTRNVQL